MSRLAAVARSRSPIWWAALGVALCGVVATAHGLYEVVAGCTVPVAVAALYVPITDGLALVAYAATDRLKGWSRAYAWTVVLVAAGLSGTAQAVYLGGLGEPPVELRYGVGAWPAVAVAAVAHLLWLVARATVRTVAAPVAPQVSAPATAPSETVAPVATSKPEAVALEVASAPATEVGAVAPPVAAVAFHRPRTVAATAPRRSQVTAAAADATRPSRREKAPCGPDCDRPAHREPVSYDTRKRCADQRAAATATG